MTGLEFSYSQAAPSMKSVLQAIWLLTVAFGNVIDILISGTKLIKEPEVEFFTYAGLMGIVMIFFIGLAWKYKYVDRDRISASAETPANESSEEITEMRKLSKTSS